MQITAARGTVPDNNQSMTTLTTSLIRAHARSSGRKAESNSASYLPPEHSPYRHAACWVSSCWHCGPSLPLTQGSCCMLQYYQVRVFPPRLISSRSFSAGYKSLPIISQKLLPLPRALVQISNKAMNIDAFL